MKSLRVMFVSLAPLAVLALDLPSRSRGIYNPGIARSAPACGACHRSTPGAAAGVPRIQVQLRPATLSPSAGQSIGVTVTALGGQTASTRGGFAVETSAGTFSAGANTSVQAAGSAITHASSNARSWSFGYTAPTTPGLVELFAVSNTVDGDGNNGSGDMWAFHGVDDRATIATPVRLFVNATGVQAIGEGCVGGFGNVPVLGSRHVPTVGNAGFALEVHGAPPTAALGLMLGVGAFTPPIDLGLFGIPGCVLHLNPLVTVNATTGTGDAQRGEGSAILQVPIPGGPGLRSRTILFQAYLADPASGRPLPLTLTNGLAVTLQ